MSEMTSAALDYYRDVRDALSEAAFFQLYGNLFSYLGGTPEAGREARAQALDPRELPVVKDALAAIDQGGYAEAVTRVGALLARTGEPMPLERLHLRHELIADYRELLPAITPDAWRRLRGEQDIVVRYEPERALETLPQLLKDPADRERLLTLFDRLLKDERFQRLKPNDAQVAMFGRIDALLRHGLAGGKRLAAVAPLRPS
jgi:hypothetical protein